MPTRKPLTISNPLSGPVVQIGVIYGSPEITSGGNALKFYASVRLDVRRKETISGAKGEQIGIKVKAKVGWFFFERTASTEALSNYNNDSALFCTRVKYGNRVLWFRGPVWAFVVLFTSVE